MIAPDNFRSHAGSHFHVHPWHAVFVLIVGILLTLVLVVLVPLALGKIVFTLDERCDADTLVGGQFYTSGLNPSMPPNHAADG